MILTSPSFTAARLWLAAFLPLFLIFWDSFVLVLVTVRDRNLHFRDSRWNNAKWKKTNKRWEGGRENGKIFQRSDSVLLLMPAGVQSVWTGIGLLVHWDLDGQVLCDSVHRLELFLGVPYLYNGEKERRW